MDELKVLLKNMLTEELEQIILSNSVDKEKAVKVRIRPVLLKDELVFQETLYRGTQVFHSNFAAQEMADRIVEYLNSLFRQAELKTTEQSAVVLVSKKGKMTIKSKKTSQNGNGNRNGNGNGKENENGNRKNGFSKAEAGRETEEKQEGKKDRRAALAHNRVKHYILEEGKPVDFLVGLGVQTPDGRVTKAKYDKFRQINRYLEFIEDVLEELPADRTLRIIDFGCGKSYLTFAMYYYLHELQHRDIQVTGLDLKTEVIDNCNRLAQQCGYEQLHFEKGDISTYEGADSVDMVVTLHACDTATDYALDKAVKWGARVIMAVPCCQHEVNKQIKCDVLAPVFKYGLIKERMAALVTDALRANLLEQKGYDTQILEFIDMEHTPKNLLIRAVKQPGMRPRQKGDIQKVTELLQINPTLQNLLAEEQE